MVQWSKQIIRLNHNSNTSTMQTIKQAREMLRRHLNNESMFTCGNYKLERDDHREDNLWVQAEGYFTSMKDLAKIEQIAECFGHFTVLRHVDRMEIIPIPSRVKRFFIED